MTGRHRQELLILAIGNVLLLALCWLQIPEFGQVGAASAVVLGFGATNVLRFAYVAKVLGFVPGRLADVAPAFVALTAAYLVRRLDESLGEATLWGTFMSCSLYAFVYAALCYFFLLKTETRSTIDLALKARFKRLA
jgi:O-antigen/teichoic acid export membrane protein